ILHRDIRAENILITFNETAKLANFNSIAALSPSHKLDRIRYCAPELMKRSPYVKYDNRCEVFSFGILLWEIAEKRFPHQGGTANHSQIKAKYYKAIYISKGYVRSPPNKDKIVAELFKEVADDEANDFPAAKVRYGDCLYHGKGVDQKFSEALKYFEKAAEDDFKVAMYNAGSMYYDGFGCTKDIEKTKYYMKLAIYNNYEAAIKFCKEHNL
ncbi:hypothetical protein RhiirA5_466140, partial [Rhizophagus irregularis]